MGSPLRILHVVVNMNRGGAETLIMNLYRNIDRSKIQFDFLTCKEGVFDEEIVGMSGRIHRVPYVTDVGHFGYVKALDAFFTSHPEYKIVHSHMDKMSGLVLRSAKKAGIPIRIAHSHSTKSEGILLERLYKSYAGHYILSNTTHLLSCSNTAAKWLFSNQMDNVIILKNGIDCDRFVFSSNIRNQVREELKLFQNNFVVGHVGRFSHPKNHLFLIDIFAQIIKAKPESVLVLAGDGPLRIDIEKKVTDLNLVGKVKFLGVRSDINRLLQAFDIFVFPSLYEGVPVTLIEAQASGLPCVTSNMVTEEVDMGLGLISFENLNNPPYAWAKNILSINKRVQNVKGNIKNKGYDVKETAIWLEKFYSNAL